MLKKIITGSALIGMLAVSSVPAMAAELDTDNSRHGHGHVNLTNVTPITNETAQAFPIALAGDTSWDYGTSLTDWGTRKKVWSNFNHLKYSHRSSCQIGTTYNGSEWKPAKQTSYSSAKGDLFADTNAWYDY